jgi:hypothetical protein
MTQTLSRTGESRLGFEISIIRACFGFRASDFEFSVLRYVADSV